MLLRILTINVHPARVADWMRFTRDVGFPGMLAQPGCRQIWRLRGHDAPRDHPFDHPGDHPGDHQGGDYKVMTLWDGLAELERFRASAAMRRLSDAAAPLTMAPATEQLFDIVDDAAA